MKKLFPLFSRIAVVTFIAAGLCFGVSTQAAQKKEESKTSPSPSASTSKSPATAPLSAKDKSFMKDAAQGGMMEVEMGKMAQQNGKSADVKAFASKTSAVIKKHLDMVKAAQAKLK